MAEALLRTINDERFEVFSCGLRPTSIHPMTLQVLEEKGVDTSSLEAKGAREYLGKQSFAYVVIVCGKAEKECPSAWPLVKNRLFWPFEDPAAFEGTEEEKLGEFRRVRDLIEVRLKEWVSELDREGRL